jgi:hypothetical protein
MRGVLAGVTGAVILAVTNRKNCAEKRRESEDFVGQEKWRVEREGHGEKPRKQLRKEKDTGTGSLRTQGAGVPGKRWRFLVSSCPSPVSFYHFLNRSLVCGRSVAKQSGKRSGAWDSVGGLAYPYYSQARVWSDVRLLSRDSQTYSPFNNARAVPNPEPRTGIIAPRFRQQTTYGIGKTSSDRPCRPFHPRRLPESCNPATGDVRSCNRPARSLAR